MTIEKAGDRVQPARASFIKGKDNRIDVARLRPENREELKRILQDAELAAALGVDKPAATPVEPTPRAELPAFVVPIFCQTLETINRFALSRARVPTSIIDRVAPYTPAQQDAIREPLGNVLAKYSALDTLKKWPELALLVALGGITLDKLTTAQMLMAQQPAKVIPMRAPDAAPGQPAEPTDTALPTDVGDGAIGAER